MKELTELLKQGESLMKEIRETLDKKEDVVEVVVRPGMRVHHMGEFHAVATTTMYNRCNEGCDLGSLVPITLRNGTVWCVPIEQLTHKGKQVTVYKDD